MTDNELLYFDRLEFLRDIFSKYGVDNFTLKKQSDHYYTALELMIEEVVKDRDYKSDYSNPIILRAGKSPTGKCIVSIDGEPIVIYPLNPVDDSFYEFAILKAGENK